jgi:hypothetical protein
MANLHPNTNGLKPIQSKIEARKRGKKGGGDNG